MKAGDHADCRLRFHVVQTLKVSTLAVLVCLPHGPPSPPVNFQLQALFGPMGRCTLPGDWNTCCPRCRIPFSVQILFPPRRLVATIRPHQSAVVVHLRQAVVTLNTPVTSRVSDRREHRSIGQTKDRPSCWLLCGTAVSMRAGGVSQMEL